MSSSLEKAQHATDAANERAAKAAILIKKLGDVTLDTSKVYGYDAGAGTLTAADTAVGAGKGYGKHDAHDAGHKDKAIYMMISDDDEVTMMWSAANTAPAASTFTTADVTLCGTKTGFDTDHNP